VQAVVPGHLNGETHVGQAREPGLDEDSKQPNQLPAELVNCISLSNVVIWDTFQSNTS